MQIDSVKSNFRNKILDNLNIGIFIQRSYK